MAHEMTEEDLKLEIRSFIYEYYKATKNDPNVAGVVNLGILARRFGTASRKRFNKSVQQLLSGDERFELAVRVSGRTEVICDLVLNEMFLG